MTIAPAVRGRVKDTRIELIENTAVRLTRKDEFIREIGKLWGDAQQKFVLIGRYLRQAKETLPYGEYEAMIARELPFGRAVAHQLRAVADAIDTGALPVDRLPPSYSTVYQITTLSEDERARALERGLIRPTVTRAELMAFKKAHRGPTGHRSALIAERERLRAEQARIAARLEAIAQELNTIDAVPGA